MRNLNYKQQAGFTMLELMIIIIIIGILAALTAPSFFDWIPTMHLKTDAKANLNVLREARSMAVSNDAAYGVYFDTDANLVYLFKDSNNFNLATYEPALDSVVATTELDNETIYSSCTFVNNTVIFYPSGSSSNSGQVTLQNESGSHVYDISVLASTGRVKLERQ